MNLDTNQSLDKIVILDFGSQYTQLIAKKIRQLKVYSVVLPCYATVEEIKSYSPRALVLSGGPSSIFSEHAPKYDKNIFSSDLDIPILGVCYGMQLIVHHFNGKVHKEGRSEYGHAEIQIDSKLASDFFSGVASGSRVWMSHQDRVTEVSGGFEVIAKTVVDGDECIAGVYSKERNIYGIQFHLEVEHSDDGLKMMENFLFKIVGIRNEWSMDSFIDHEVEEIRKKVGDKKVILALSGGVDSSVLAVLLHKAIGENLLCVFVDNGLLRSGEKEKVVETFTKHFKINLKVVHAENYFLRKLNLVKDPEKKRRTIGKLFLKILLKYSKGYDFLAQGTLYPDVIESVSFKGPSDTIKTHHNRVKPILKLMKEGKIIEPFNTLFKDEVRKIGVELGVPDGIIRRQPFPGPGLAVRILGIITRKRLRVLREADKIFLDKVKEFGYYDDFWQSFAVLLPVKSVGVMGDKRHYGYTIVLRAVSSVDGMTADFEILSKAELTEVSNAIIGNIDLVTRVVWDISSKPPATIEWE